MIVTEAYYLEHFGVRGQKWGVRKHEEERRARAERFAPKSKMSKKKKVAIAAVVVGAGVAAVILGRRAGINMNSIRSLPSRASGAKSAASVLNSVGQRAASSVPKTPKKPEMSRETQDFIKKFNAKQTALNRAANANLRARDNDLNVPVYLRTYLPDWD